MLDDKAKILILESENTILKKDLLLAQEHIIAFNTVKPSKTRIGKVMQLIDFHKWYRGFR